MRGWWEVMGGWWGVMGGQWGVLGGQFEFKGGSWVVTGRLLKISGKTLKYHWLSLHYGKVVSHTWYLSPRSPTCRWRRNLPCGEISDFNTWNFSTWRGISVFPHNRCGEMWIFAKFGEISHFSTGQMWRNLKFIQFFVIKSVLRCFCEIRFGAIYALLRGENFCKKLGRWRKNDKYQVWSQVVHKLSRVFQKTYLAIRP